LTIKCSIKANEYLFIFRSRTNFWTYTSTTSEWVKTYWRTSGDKLQRPLGHCMWR